MSETPLTVYIVFGSSVTGTSLIQALIECAKSFDLLGHSRNEAEAISVIARHRPDLLILEDSLSEGQGMHIVQQVAAERWARYVIMISTDAVPPPPYEFQAKGIDLWFRLPEDSQHLRAALKKLAEAKRHVMDEPDQQSRSA